MSRRLQPTEAPGAIALAVYRPNPQLLAEQVRSIAGQTYEHWRCHVGIDGTDEIALTLLAEVTAGDERFVVHHYADNVGIFRNFERILQHVATTGARWVALSDQDDSWNEDKLARLVETLDASPDVTAVVGQARLVDDRGTVLGRTQRRSVPLGGLILDNQVTGSLAVFDRSVLDVALPFPEPTPAAYHDHWLGVAASILGHVEFLDDEVQDYVQHADNALGEEMARGAMKRVRSLAVRSRGPREMLTLLAVERWGWRARMATTLTARLEGRAFPADLRDVARARTIKTSVLIWRSVLTRHAGAQRALAIWLGFLWSRVSTPAPQPEARGGGL